MQSAYEREALGFARLAMSHWNREPSSPSFGSFDRAYWGWKKKDMPDATLQAAVALCTRLAEREGHAEAAKPLLRGFVGHLEDIQHPNGSFDQIYPYEFAPGVVHDMLGSLLGLLRSPLLAPELEPRLERVIRRALDYALSSDEKHGEIANHFAEYASELINAGHVLGEARATARGKEYLARTLALLTPGEGWFSEYDGPDAGYQTRLLAFLTRIAELTADEALWKTCEEAADFVERLLMPDDALHPMFGVRSTALVYPSGFERLAARSPRFACLAERVHASWADASTPVPSRIDFENGVRLAEDAFEAAAIRVARGAGPAEAPVSNV